MDRIEFAKILGSVVIPEGTPPEEIDSQLRPISEALTRMIPDSLFRFRSFNDMSVGAFRDGIIYAVTADMFNDPFDTLASYDHGEIKKGMSAIMSCEGVVQLKEWLEKGNDFPEIIKQRLPSGMAEELKEKLLSIDDVKTIENRILDTRQEMISSIELYFPILSEMSKRFSTVACFCESVLPILMWSHYADSHKGFTLEYNFRTTLEHPIKNVGLFPVIYGEERVDASSYIAWEYLFMMGLRAPNPDIMSSIKNVLYKSSIWAYEKEWRLIDTTGGDITHERTSAIPFEPVAIYYGRHMSQENKDCLHLIAQEKRIKEFEMYVDYSSPLYEMRFRPAFT